MSPGEVCTPYSYSTASSEATDNGKQEPFAAVSVERACASMRARLRQARRPLRGRRAELSVGARDGLYTNARLQRARGAMDDAVV